jgi:hypothetical protein
MSRLFIAGEKRGRQLAGFAISKEGNRHVEAYPQSQRWADERVTLVAT